MPPGASFAFDARIALARTEQKSRDIPYYVLQGDDVGLLLREVRNASVNFIDMDLLSSGHILQDLSAVFYRYWNSRSVRRFDNGMPP